MADTARKPCRRCLLREIDEAEYFQKLHTYIERIPADEKASAEEYSRRLSVCKECEHLQDGTCGLCGCYVEVRAAAAGNRCPDVPASWGRCRRGRG